MAEQTVFSWDRYYSCPVVGIIRGMREEVIMALAEAYFGSGFSTLEITMNTDGAAALIAKLRQQYPEENIGAGTVCSLEDLDQAVAAGASFIVTPTLDLEVIHQSVKLGIPIFPGAYTPTEIHQAWKNGAAAVKVFPATQLGPQYIKDVLAPLSEIKLLPTGGVSLENIATFFKAGAVGVGMGSSLFQKDLVQQRDYQGLKKYLVKIRRAIEDFV